MKLLKLTVEEKQSLLGPAVVGCLLGALAAYAVFAFASELNAQSGGSFGILATAGEAILMFAACAAGTVGVLGCIPIVVGRLRSGRNGDA